MSIKRKEWKNLKLTEIKKTTRKKELNIEDFQEKKPNDLMTPSQKEQHKVKWKLEQRLQRQRKKECQIILTHSCCH